MKSIFLLCQWLTFNQSAIYYIYFMYFTLPFWLCDSSLLCQFFHHLPVTRTVALVELDVLWFQKDMQCVECAYFEVSCVHFSVLNVYFAVFSVHFSVSNVYFAVSSVHFSVSNAYFAVSSVHFSVLNIYFAMWRIILAAINKSHIQHFRLYYKVHIIC